MYENVLERYNIIPSEGILKLKGFVPNKVDDTSEMEEEEGEGEEEEEEVMSSMQESAA